MFLKLQELKHFPLGSHRFLGIPLFQYFEERDIIDFCASTRNSVGTQLLNGSKFNIFGFEAFTH